MTLIVYWTIKERGAGKYLISFWTKPDKSNALEFTAVTMEEEKLRTRIMTLTGHKKFEMHYMKTTWTPEPPRISRRPPKL